MSVLPQEIQDLKNEIEKLYISFLEQNRTQSNIAVRKVLLQGLFIPFAYGPRSSDYAIIH
jgi:hypothetical protein